MNEQFVRARIEDYKNKKATYEKFASQVLTILKEVIQEEYPDVRVASWSCRAKGIDSLEKKLRKDKYNEKSEITDLAGARIIAYSKKDIELIENVVKKSFSIDTENSIDKTSILGNDKVGYRGSHFIVSYDNDRMKLPENKYYKDMKCEVQVTTLIAHTWSEIIHEKGYKFEGELPMELERRKNLLAGMLELADMEMDAYVQTFDEYTRKIQQEVNQGGLDLEINSMSLEKYMLWKFPRVAPQIFRDIELILTELKNFGLKTIRELDQIIKPEYEEEVRRMGWRSLDGLIRNILIISDADRYFSKAWDPSMTQMNEKNFNLYKRFCVDIEMICREKNITVVNTIL